MGDAKIDGTEPVVSKSLTPAMTPDGTASASPSSNRHDLSTSYDELMQTVIWVPPTSTDDMPTDKSDITALKAAEPSVSYKGEFGELNMEATESARDAATSVAHDCHAQSNRPEAETASSSQREKSSDVLTGGVSLEEPLSLAALERNVFEMAETFRKGVMTEMETMKGWL